MFSPKGQVRYKTRTSGGEIGLVRKAGLDSDHLFLETEDLFPKKYCFESNEKKSLEGIQKETFKINCKY